MRLSPLALRGLVAGSAAAALALALAATAAEPVTEVYVEAPKVVHSGAREPATGAPVDIVSIKYRVSYGDLNLATPAGAKALEDRIHDAAKRACRQLEAETPPGTVNATTNPPCVKTAVDNAMKQARAAIAAAGPKAK
ncbi:MAG: UrcA family protein [Proteobacteria bacterium]|nr:UrcA family protein [Pseudomonadota bacterium]